LAHSDAITWLTRQFELRRRNNPSYSLRTFAKRCGVSPSTMSELMAGRRSLTERNAARITERLGLPATLDNDANCATVGEWWQGAARGGRNVVGMTIGTGIGGGLIIDGQLFHGSSDVAGEIGHTTIDLNGRHCKCGNYGCLEAYASGPAIAMRLTALPPPPPTPMTLMRAPARLSSANLNRSGFSCMSAIRDLQN
jgi:hypothetical protein